MPRGLLFGVRGCGVVAILGILLKLNIMTRSAAVGSRKKIWYTVGEYKNVNYIM
jgi:hypothetical protein